MPRARSTHSPKGRWASYNRWRAAHRTLDRQRRLARAEAKAAQALEVMLATTEVRRPLIPKLGKPWALVRIDFGSGRTASLRVRLGPAGPIISPSRVSQWVRRELQFQLAQT